jgi:hypothetical protein
VKEIKPHEERFFKDIVLNSILEEIANEQEKPLHDLIPSNPKKRTKTQTAFLSLISLSIIVSAAFLVPIVIEVTEPIQASSQTLQHTALQTAKQTPKETAVIPDQQPTKLLVQSQEESPLILISQNSAEISTEQLQQSEHERAKAELLKQMKN